MDALNQSFAWKIFSFKLSYTGGIREGLLLCLEDGERIEKWGEISPFPGRNQETLSDALAQLLQLLHTGKVKTELFPSVQFGLESALSPYVNLSVPLYALLSGNFQNILEQADLAQKQGYSTVKLKVASFSLEETQHLIHALKDRFRIRIDCNSAFSFEKAVSLFSPFDPAVFDYIEDPTYEWERLKDFPHYFALDETLSQHHLIPNTPHLYGFILKPTVLGGFKGCTPYVEYAKQHQLKIVFSSAFESGLGLLQILNLAQKFHLNTDSAGIDTHRYLNQDVLNEGVNFNTPHLTSTSYPSINRNAIQEIAHGKCELSPL